MHHSEEEEELGIVRGRKRIIKEESKSVAKEKNSKSKEAKSKDDKKLAGKKRTFKEMSKAKTGKKG